MKRSYLTIIGILIAVLVSGCGLAGKDKDQEKKNEDKVWKVGILSGSPIFDSAITALQEELTKAGYVEGKNIEYTIQSANGNEEEMARISQEYVDNDVDMIISTTNAGGIAAKKATDGTDIPVIFMFVIAPVEVGIVDDLGNIENVTGVRNPLEDFVGRRLELLLELDPTATRIWAPMMHNMRQYKRLLPG
jgi:putative tryptophan/tyrosine transport system substrate-binding protein